MPTMCIMLGVGNTKMSRPSSLILKMMFEHDNSVQGRVHQLCGGSAEESPRREETEPQKQHPRLTEPGLTPKGRILVLTK